MFDLWHGERMVLASCMDKWLAALLLAAADEVVPASRGAWLHCLKVIPTVEYARHPCSAAREG